MEAIGLNITAPLLYSTINPEFNEIPYEPFRTAARQGNVRRGS
jgi:hypothetical protein